ncbi:MAG: molybdenum cofactor guanylyltransferase [Verrucomicrobiota bacterium]
MNDPDRTEFSAALLAGGASTRMGVDKATLLFEGEPLWRRQLATLRGTGPGELLVSCRPPGHPFETEGGILCVYDGMGGMGPLGGMAALMRRARFEFLLVLAIDLPRVNARFLQSLIRQAIGSGRGVVPREERWFQPLAAVYPRAALPLADAHLCGEDRSMQHFVRRALELGLVAEYRIEEAESDLFRNVNTPADLQITRENTRR